MAEYNCKGCTYKTKRQSDIVRHVKNNGPKKCYDFGDIPIKERYGRDIPIQKASIHCCKCSRKFSNSSNRIRHEKNCDKTPSPIKFQVQIKKIPEFSQIVQTYIPTPIIIDKTFIDDHVYILQTNKFFGTNVYKIGRSKYLLSRINQYKCNCDVNVYGAWKVVDCILVENLIKALFKSKFKLVKGHEYFDGPLEEMITHINKLVQIGIK